MHHNTWKTIQTKAHHKEELKDNLGWSMVAAAIVVAILIG